MTTRGALVALVVCVAAGAGCGLTSQSAEAAAWVADVTARSRRADEASARGDGGAARELLVSMARGSGAPGVAAADLRAVRMDACHRLALIELAAGRPGAARAWADEGLAVGAGRDVFTANLHLDRGRALEAAGVDLEAAASYHRALVVTEALLGSVLGTGTPP